MTEKIFLQPVRKTAVLILSSMLFLAGCGSKKETDTSDQTEGFYDLIQVNEGDTVTEQEEIDILKEAGEYAWLEIGTDQAMMNIFGEITVFTPDLENNVLTAEMTGEKMNLTKEEGNLILQNDDLTLTFRKGDKPEDLAVSAGPRVLQGSWDSYTFRREGDPHTGYFDVIETWNDESQTQGDENARMYSDDRYYHLTAFGFTTQERASWTDTSAAAGLEMYVQITEKQYADTLTDKEYGRFEQQGYEIKNCMMSFSDETRMKISVFTDASDTMHFFIFETYGAEAGDTLNEFADHTLNSFRTEG